MMQPIFPFNIRYGVTGDAKLLSELGAKTFYDTFAKDNTPENIATYLKASFSPEIQFRELSSPENIFLIVESQNIPIGFVQLILDSKQESIKGTKSLEIRRIYALQDYIGKGVGKTLMEAAIQVARQRGCDSIWLGVWEQNPKAIHFYQTWGFKKVGTHIFYVGEDPQRDFIMVLKLASHTL
jgi:diamine N-acetyltransferase